MGYRTLLKKYIRHLEIVAGDNFVEIETREPLLTPRDLGELKTLAAEIQRESRNGRGEQSMFNYNYRLRLLINRYALEASDVADIMDVEEATVRRWHTTPRSDQYLAMTEQEFSEFERRLAHHLESEVRNAGR
jgi:hypothetical protein